MAEPINEQQEAMFKDAFFRGKTFDEGIEMAGKALCISPADTLNYFMTYDPINPHDITSSYIFACRYKRHHDDGISCNEIANYLGYKRTVISSSVKIAEVFAPADIKNDLVFSDYRKAVYAVNPQKVLNKIRNAKRDKATNSIGRFGKEDVKEQFIAQSLKAYQMLEAGISLSEIAKDFGISRKQANVLTTAGAIPKELMQRSRFEDIKRATQSIYPESYLIVKEKDNAKLQKEQSIVVEDQVISSEISEGVGVKRLSGFVLMALNVLAKNKHIKNNRQLKVIKPGINSENSRFKSIVAIQEQEIAQLKKQNNDLLKENELVKKLSNKVNELSRLITND